jgi:hypothetical protein
MPSASDRGSRTGAASGRAATDRGPLGHGLYLRYFVQFGLVDVGRRRLGWRMWWGGPWLPTLLVTATMPEQRA